MKIVASLIVTEREQEACLWFFGCYYLQKCIGKEGSGQAKLSGLGSRGN